jgi:hypothetical protein
MLDDIAAALIRGGMAIAAALVALRALGLLE